MASDTTKHDRMPMPNCPMKSVGPSPSRARLELRPMVARKVCTSSGVRPMPLSIIITVGGFPLAWWISMRMSPTCPFSSFCRAVMASVAFCISSRTKTSGPL